MLKATLAAFVMSISWILDGICNIVRGITQVITTPLAWLKIIIREIITRAIGSPKFEDSKRVQKLLSEYNLSPEGLPIRSAIHCEVNRKFFRAADVTGQRTDISPTIELTTGTAHLLDPFEKIADFMTQKSKLN